MAHKITTCTEFCADGITKIVYVRTGQSRGCTFTFWKSPSGQIRPANPHTTDKASSKIWQAAQAA